MTISPKQNHPSRQVSSEKKNLKRTVMSLLKNTTYIFCTLLCLSVPSFSMESENLEDAYWSKAIAQKSVDDIYWSRLPIQATEDGPIVESSLSQEEKDFLLTKCALAGHPMAQMEIIANFFCKKSTRTGKVKIEKVIHKDCHGIALKEELKITPVHTVLSQILEWPLQEHVTLSEFCFVKEFAKSALQSVLDRDDYKNYISSIGGFGLGGLYPYQPFADKELFTQEDCKEIFVFWHRKHQESQKLSKEDETEGRLTFFDRHAITPLWIQCLYNNTKDTEFFFLVHRLLNKLDELPETDSLDDLPWWKDRAWEEL